MADCITIDLCGRLADGIGTSLTVPLVAPTAVATVIARLVDAYPSLGQTSIHIAIDDALADEGADISPGQRLALFPPVSGG